VKEFITKDPDNSPEDFLKLNREIINGTANGKVLWQPRIDCWYDDRIFTHGKLSGQYEGMSRMELYRELGCSARLYEYNNCLERFEIEPVMRRSEKLSQLHTRHYIETPLGTLTYIESRNKSNGGSYKSEWMVKSEKDIRKLIWLENNTHWKFNRENWILNNTLYKNLGLPCLFIQRINIQHAIIDTFGYECTVEWLYDNPKIMEEYFEASENSAMRSINALALSPFEWINFGDNIHGRLITNEWFEKYILPAYHRRCETLKRAGKFTFAHWDGDCAPILKYAKESSLDAIEAISPLPQGDVTLEEIKEALGDEVFLIDGIPAILFDEIYPIQQLEAMVEKLIDLFAPKLILGISDEMSSTGDIERIRFVGEIVDKYNASL